MLELAVGLFGLVGGYSLGQRLRQAVYDESDYLLGGGAAAASSAAHADADSRLQQKKNLRGRSLSSLDGAAAARESATVTVMLVGDPAVGKTLLLKRLSDAHGALPQQSLPQTMYPTWQRADFAFAAGGETIFQILDTPGRIPELSVPFFRHMDTVVLVFDVGRASTFAHVKELWHEYVEKHRLALPSAAKHAPESVVVLANIIDERRERQVTRREAAAWAASVGIQFFETHPAEHTPKLMVHLDAVMRRHRATSTQSGPEAPADQ